MRSQVLIYSYLIYPFTLTGYMARNQIRDSGGTIGGEGLAKAGIIIGWIGVGLTLIGCCIMSRRGVSK